MADLINLFSKGQKEELHSSLLDFIFQLTQKGIINYQRMCHSCIYFEKKGDEMYCALLEKKLQNQDLRVDCLEHVAY